MTGRYWVAAGGAATALVAPLLVADDTLLLLATGCAAAIGAIGLNLVVGYAGQVALGHAFFLGVGAYTAVALSGPSTGGRIGLGMTFLPGWLLAAGIVAAATGALLGWAAMRVRGLYLGIVTIGLVFLGLHVFATWTALTGGPGVGRPAAVPVAFGIHFGVDGTVLTRAQKLYWLLLVLLVLFAVLGRNIARSDVGRRFAAVRDHEIAASLTGVNVPRAKLLAFVLSSFYGGCAGALLYTVIGYTDPTTFGLLLSVDYIAMVLIGGAATTAGPILGAFFITLLPTVTRALPRLVPVVGTSATDTPNVFQLESVLAGLLLIGFLLFEPRGLIGIWMRGRNYWRTSRRSRNGRPAEGEGDTCPALAPGTPSWPG